VRLLAVSTALATVLLAGGCAGDDNPKTPIQSPATRSSTAPAATPTPGPTSTMSTPTERVRHLGIDASHHQGAIDWAAVGDDGISFAYLKATEGTGFTDPLFASHREAAIEVGLEVGGYHYFQLCSPGAEQAAHFVSVLGRPGSNHLPPAVDLELAGSCSTPPPRADLLREVRAFLDEVERATGVEPVVYLYPELEERFGFASELARYRQWVRSLGARPDRPWWIWQRTDQGSVAGVDGPVDVNVLRRRVPGQR
jgi:lysozyme